MALRAEPELDAAFEGIERGIALANDLSPRSVATLGPVAPAGAFLSDLL